MGTPIFLDITAEEYHAMPLKSSSSIRCYIGGGSLEYYERYISRALPEITTTEYMRRGTVLHALFEHSDRGLTDLVDIIPNTIQSDEFRDQANSELDSRSKAKLAVVGDEINLRQATHRRYMQLRREHAESNGMLWVTSEEAMTLALQLEAILENGYVFDMLTRDKNATREQACVDGDRKALADVWQPGKRHIIDLKSTSERTPNGFNFDAQRRKYHLQLDWYEQIFEATSSGIIAVTSEPPHIAMYYEFDDELRMEARERNRRAYEEILVRERMGGGRREWMPDGWDASNLITKSGVEEMVELRGAKHADSPH